MALFTLSRTVSATTTNDPIEDAYRREMRALVASRVKLLWTLIVAFLWTACALGWFYFPERSSAILILCATALFVGIANVRLVRTVPDQTLLLTGLATTALSLSFCAYIAHVHGLAELCVMGLMVFLTGLVVMFPWGWRGQGLVSCGLVFGYLLALKGGATPVLPVPYGVLILMMSATLTTVGADLLETHRLAAYRHAIASEKANALKSEFLATVSHELRTPLTVIIGFTDLLLEGGLPEPAAQIDALRRVHQHSLKLLDLIQSMLDLNRLESGGLQLRIEALRLAEVFDGLRDSLPTNWLKEGVRLDWQLGDRNLAMRSDRAKIEMIVRNLIHNALKYTETGSVTVAAEAAAPGRVRLSVSDTGPGIKADELASIFEMFRQAKSQAPRGGGVGLGLYIVKRLTEMLGGEVTVESTPGVGTCFAVSLPAQAPLPL